MDQRCLVIADDLTGAADTGAQFAKKGLKTLVIPIRQNRKIEFSQYLDIDVLVLTSHSRGLAPQEASRKVSSLLEGYPKSVYSVIYKKIDSTLRGNIGSETDAILKNTGLAWGFLTPALPEQGRIVVGGIHLVRGKPLSLSEVSRDAISPVKESYVKKLLEKQSDHQIGNMGIIEVASGGETLKKAVREASRQGIQILIFDAVERRDLAHIAEVAFTQEKKPLLIGSAGLAKEVAKRFVPKAKGLVISRQKTESAQSILIVSASASRISHEQLNRVERTKGVPSFLLGREFLTGNESHRSILEEEYASKIGKILLKGNVILKVCQERMLSADPEDVSVPVRITQCLGRIVASALERSHFDTHDFAILLFGGDTTLSILHHLKTEGIEIDGELFQGVVSGRIVGGRWHGLRLITKAGGFGRKNTLEKILDILGVKDS